MDLTVCTWRTRAPLNQEIEWNTIIIICHMGRAVFIIIFGIYEYYNKWISFEWNENGLCINSMNLNIKHSHIPFHFMRNNLISFYFSLILSRTFWLNHPKIWNILESEKPLPSSIFQAKGTCLNDYVDFVWCCS